MNTHGAVASTKNYTCCQVGQAVVFVLNVGTTPLGDTAIIVKKDIIEIQLKLSRIEKHAQVRSTNA